MRKYFYIIPGALLLLSNGYWIYRIVDCGVTQSYKEQQIYELEETRKQLMKTLPSLVRDMPKAGVIRIFSRHSGEKKYEKDGCIRIGWTGLKFNKEGKLTAVSPAWDYGGKGPCWSPDDK